MPKHFIKRIGGVPAMVTGIKEPPKCPKCGEALNRIGYTCSGAVELDRSGEWLDTDWVGETEYYCLACDYHFDNEELQQTGVV